MAGEAYGKTWLPYGSQAPGENTCTMGSLLFPLDSLPMAIHNYTLSFHGVLS